MFVLSWESEVLPDYCSPLRPSLLGLFLCAFVETVGQSHENKLRPAASGRRAIRREPLARDANFEGQLVLFVQVNPRQRLASDQRTAGGRRSQF